MAVEATNLNFFPQPQLITNRDFAVTSNQRNVGLYDFTGQMGSAESLMPFPPSFVYPLKKAECESGVTHNAPCPQRKRVRDSLMLTKQPEMAANFPLLGPMDNSSTFLGDEDIASHLRQQQLEIDQIVAHHTKKIRMEVEEREKKHVMKLAAAIREGMMRKMKEKEEEVQRMGRLNWFLQERVNSLYMENKLWREMAQTTQATANSLRSNLEQVLAAAHVSEERHMGGGADDAESSCGSSGDHQEKEREEEEEERRERKCKRCGERESGVVLLPCRHLCLCTICGSSLPDACPVCHSYTTASVHINFSP